MFGACFVGLGGHFKNSSTQGHLTGFMEAEPLAPPRERGPCGHETYNILFQSLKTLLEPHRTLLEPRQRLFLLKL